MHYEKRATVPDTGTKAKYPSVCLREMKMDRDRDEATPKSGIQIEIWQLPSSIQVLIGNISVIYIRGSFPCLGKGLVGPSGDQIFFTDADIDTDLLTSCTVGRDCT